jgi:hypothetical protein
LTSGYLLSQAILVALIERETSSRGQWVHFTGCAATLTEAVRSGTVLRRGDNHAFEM